MEVQELLSVGLIFSIACFAGAVIAVSAGLSRAGNTRELPWVALIYGTAVGAATSSAPFVATLVDVSGLIIYFTVAGIVLRGTLL